MFYYVVVFEIVKDEMWGEYIGDTNAGSGIVLGVICSIFFAILAISANNTIDRMFQKKLRHERLLPHEIILDSKNGLSETKITMYSLALLTTFVSYFLCHGILERIKEKIQLLGDHKEQTDYLSRIRQFMWLGLIVGSIVSIVIMVFAAMYDPVYRREVGLDCDAG